MLLPMTDELLARLIPGVRMRYREHPPPPALCERVACFWSITAPAGAPGHRVLPDGCVDILFDASGPPVVVGAMTRAIVTQATTRPTELLGVRFRPGEAAAVLGVSLRELSNGTVDLADVWGERGRRVADAVLERRTVDGRLGLLSRAIEERLATRQNAEAGDVTTRRVRAAVRFILGAERLPTIDALASRLGVTGRTLERAFDERVGLRPKALVRVVRLQRVVGAMDRGAPTWTALAYDEGFSDQAHLVREVRALAGASPTALLRERLSMSDSFNPARSVGATVPPSVAHRP
jgi:AraC-like DNA-binding protein